MYQNKKRYALTNGIILDGTCGMVPQRGRTIYISGGRIVDIADGSQLAAGYEPVNLNGKYVLPGLINMHVHCPPPASRKKSRPTPENW